MNKLLLSILAVAVSFAGCTMAPKYERPAAPVSGEWRPGLTNSPGATTNASTAEIEWREFFNDPRLQKLIALSLTNNRDLRIAALRVEQFRAQYRIQGAAYFPDVSGNAGLLRQQTSGAVSEFNGGTIVSTYNVTLGASYEVDLFGRVRSLKNEALELYFATEEARKSAQIALVSEVAMEYLTQLRLLEAKAVAAQTLKTVQASYDLIKRSLELGASSELDLRTAEGQVQSVRVNSASFLQLLAESENRLVQLVGQPLPADLPPARPFREQSLLTDLPVGVPSEVLQRRPDVLAAEHTLKSVNANIGAVRAAFFPQIVLTGSAGTASAKLTDLFTGPSETWSFSPRITVPLFDIAVNRTRLDVAKIQKRIEIANYERVIQIAFREVADALAARGIIDEKIKAQELLLTSQQKRFDLTEARYKQGVDNYLDVLLAQQDLYRAQQDLLQYQAARLLNAIALYQSLGGGWTMAQDPNPPRHDVPSADKTAFNN
jgi:multidrug efflux system outer membrane protein